jgi:LysM repeat protein
MRLRLGLVALLAASLACNLGSPSTTRSTPTTRPTVGVADNASTSIALQPTIQASSPAPTQVGAACTPRTDWPSMTVGEGETLSAIAARVGSSIDDLVAANCLSNPDALVAGQTLYVPVAPPSSGPVTGGGNPFVPAQDCGGNQWFFTFYAGKEDPACPGAVITSNAAGENFEGGRVYWYEAMPGSADTRGTIYVIYNDGSWETFPDTWDASQPSNDPSIAPPAGRYQPERGIGKLWREQAGVRSKLGWAYEPESAFMGRQQFPVGNTGTAYWYIDHGWRNLVLRLYSVDMAPNRWEVAGRY